MTKRIAVEIGGILFMLGIVGVVLFAWRHKGKAPAHGLVEFVPTPAAVSVLSIDSAGNLALRGVTAVAPGVVGTAGNFSPACRASANRNGEGVLTVCFTPEVGRRIRDTLQPGVW